MEKNKWCSSRVKLEELLEVRRYLKMKLDLGYSGRNKFSTFLWKTSTIVSILVRAY